MGYQSAAGYNANTPPYVLAAVQRKALANELPLLVCLVPFSFFALRRTLAKPWWDRRKVPMTKQFCLRIVGLIVFGFSPLACADDLPMVTPKETGMSAERLALVDKAMEDSIEKSLLPGGIVMVARHGEIAHFKAYGKMDLEADKPMTTETIFRIYSMSKAVTTTAAMMLIDEGKLAVNDPVSKYLPELKNVMVARGGQSHRAERTMTIADLLRHTSGYSYGSTGESAHDKAYKDLKVLDTGDTLEALQAKLTKLPLPFEPGTDWIYGISIDILGRVVEVVSSKTLDDF